MAPTYPAARALPWRRIAERIAAGKPVRITWCPGNGTLYATTLTPTAALEIFGDEKTDRSERAGTVHIAVAGFGHADLRLLGGPPHRDYLAEKLQIHVPQEDYRRADGTPETDLGAISDLLTLISEEWR